MASASLVRPSLALGSSSSSVSPSNQPLAASWQQNPLVVSRSFSFSPLLLKSTDVGRPVSIVAMATGDSSDPTEAARDILKSAQEAWDKTEDKLAVGGLGFTALIALWASTGLIGAIDRLPLIPNLFEFIGLLFTGWFIYRYLLFKPDREELFKKFDDAVAKITGSEAA